MGARLLQMSLRIFAVINLVLIPFWVLAWFATASGLGNGAPDRVQGYIALWLIPLHIVLAVYSLLHHRLFSDSWIKNSIATVLLTEQVLPAAFVVYGLSRISM